MKITLDLRSDIPIYIQIVEQVRQLVVAEKLKPGDQLPTVRALAAELRINFNTVSRAYRLLDEAGIISTQQGRGTYILEMPPPEINERLRREALEALARRYLEEAQNLAFTREQALKILREQASLPNQT
jgi:GntR family transcriptional regulator